MKELIGRNITLFFNLPTVFFLFSIVGLPVFVVIATSFTDWQLINKPDADFVWLENYIKPWQDERWVNAIGHTFYYSIATVLGQLLIGLLTALLFNRSFAGKAFYRSIWMMPMISMSVAISLVWLLFFDPPYGVLNYWITSIGLEPLEWTIDPVSAMPSLILVGIWHHTPFMTLILLSGLQSLPKEPFEAARIDGAGFFKIFFKIILPISAPILVVTVIWQFTAIWNDFLFGATFTFGNEAPVQVALNNMVLTSSSVKRYNVDMAAAIIAGFPTLIVYVLAGKYFIRGLTAGSVKG